MNKDQLELLALVLLLYYELCNINGSNPVLAYVWDIIALITGFFANILARISVEARLHYFEVIQT